jgi:hypothetical protein
MEVVLAELDIGIRKDSQVHITITGRVRVQVAVEGFETAKRTILVAFYRY